MNKSIRLIISFQLFLILAFLALAAWCFYLQYYRSCYYYSACLSQQQGQALQKPQRGTILDCRGRVLAASDKIQTIFAEPRVIQDPRSTSGELAEIVDMGAHEICKLIMESKNPGFVKIKEKADENQCDAARRIYGIGVQSGWQRHYPMGRPAAQVVGFTSDDNRGLGGIELQYDKELSGTASQNFFLADVRRRPIRPLANSSDTNKYGKDGCGIILTIDSTIQQFAREELVKQYESYQAESAVAIVAEPDSGAILAMVSIPDFSPSEARSTDANNFLNRAITDEFEPGSIIKPIVAAIALDANAVNKQEKIFCENGSYYGKGFGRIGEYHQGFGDLSVREILVNSSNIGMAKIGQRLGKDKLYKGLTYFGFGKKTGIDLPGEANGLLWPVQKWTGYSVTRIPFGQEISVTTIQLVRAFCMLANGGRSVRPYLVKAIVDNNGEIIKLKQPLSNPGQIGYVVKPEVARWIVSEAMVGVVNEGTGKSARLKKWQLFGKTGTANIAKSSEKGYSEDNYVASFVAGAPVENPAVIVLVSIRKPNKGLGKGYTGGAVAAPVAAKIIERTLPYLGVPEQAEPVVVAAK
jgi:cell division protein FtsI (penicillin-binding protein 3)